MHGDGGLAALNMSRSERMVEIDKGMVSGVVSEDILNLMKQFAEDHREIVALYVFGSLATGRNQFRSDADVAIMVKKRMGGMERVELETALANLLGRDVDLIPFGEATPLLRHQVLKYGRLLFEREPRERIEQEVAARREYLDGLSLHKIIEERQPW
jgi:uncharacterized protein